MIYNSQVIKAEYPNDMERIKHILENQVNGLVPTEIIYKLSTNFILGNLDNGLSRNNFLKKDATPYVKKACYKI